MRRILQACGVAATVAALISVNVPVTDAQGIVSGIEGISIQNNDLHVFSTFFGPLGYPGEGRPVLGITMDTIVDGVVVGKILHQMVSVLDCQG